jgi:hypothetical protein
MSRSRHQRFSKRDDNHTEIVKALRHACCSVFDLSSVGGGCPDILVGVHGKNILLEIKRPKAKGQEEGEKTPAQKKFFAEWRGEAYVVQTVDEALQACGVRVC